MVEFASKTPPFGQRMRSLDPPLQMTNDGTCANGLPLIATTAHHRAYLHRTRLALVHHVGRQVFHYLHAIKKSSNASRCDRWRQQTRPSSPKRDCIGGPGTQRKAHLLPLVTPASPPIHKHIHTWDTKIQSGTQTHPRHPRHTHTPSTAHGGQPRTAREGDGGRAAASGHAWSTG